MTNNLQTQKKEVENIDGLERTRETRVYTPRVDIVSNGDTIKIWAEMPGVDEKNVDMTVEKNILTIAVVTKPFLFEGKRRAKIADESIEKLKQDVDTLIIIPNQNLLEVADQHISMIDAVAMINDGILSQSVCSLSDIITKPGHINVDYADIRTIMKDRGLAVMGTGKASGIGRAREAALQAISSPLLENMSVAGAHAVLFNISGGKNLGLHEISEAASVIYEQAHEDATIIIGSVVDESLQDEVLVTIIATEFNYSEKSDDLDIEPHVEQLVVDNNVQSIKTEELKECKINQEAPVEQDKELAHDAFVFDIDPTDLDIPSFMRHKD